MPTSRVQVLLKSDDLDVPGSPFVHTQWTEQGVTFEYEKADDGDALTFSDLLPISMGTVQFLFVRSDRAVTLRFSNQVDAGIALVAGGMALLTGIDVSAVKINNNSGAAALIRGFAGGEEYSPGTPPAAAIEASDVAVTPAGGIAATDVQAALEELDSEKVAKAGDTMTGLLILSGNPAVALGAVTKQYADALFAAVGEQFLAPSEAQLSTVEPCTLTHNYFEGESWDELGFSASDIASAIWPILAAPFVTVRITWRTAATSGVVKWFVEVREKGDGDVLGSGAAVVSSSITDTAKGTANQLNEAVLIMPYTPTSGKRAVALRIKRDPADAQDTLAAAANIVYVELIP